MRGNFPVLLPNMPAYPPFLGVNSEPFSPLRISHHVPFTLCTPHRPQDLDKANILFVKSIGKQSTFKKVLPT